MSRSSARPGPIAPTAGAERRLVRRLDELGRVSDERGRLTRTFLSPAMRRANRLVCQWMLEAGLSVREDAAGNLIGRLEADSRAGAAGKTLLLGSHLDTVRGAGRFDGTLGVLLPIIALEELRRLKIRLPFAVEVLGFSEEEGVRFSSAYLGSKAYCGKLRAKDLNLRDENGVSVGEALSRFHSMEKSGDFHPPVAAHRPDELLGYVEVHIGQGPVLEAKNLAVGVVSAIAGQTRGKLTFQGRAGHAGTTPMRLRRDALAGAAETMFAAERLGLTCPGLVVTFGRVTVDPGVPNVIPGEAVLTLDLRHPADSVRLGAMTGILDRARAIARRRRLSCEWTCTQDDGAVAPSPRLTELLAQGIRAVQGRNFSIVSGAGHDAVVMSGLTPVAMLFVRCRGGLSHHPDEYAAPGDIGVALRVVMNFLQRFAGRVGPGSPPLSCGAASLGPKAG